MLGTKVLAEVKSPVNGKITVVKSLAFGTYLQVEGLTQSGGVVYEVWRTVLKILNRKSLIVNRCLILGLGGGSAAKLVNKYWPKAKITGVDIDPIMVELGQKYLNMPDVEVVIDDALNFLSSIINLQSSFTNHHSPFTRFDLILVDTYLGDQFPKKFESQNYIHLIRTVLARSGIAVFNRLYYGEKRAEAVRFGEKLDKVFGKVERVFPEANIMFVWYNKEA